MDVPGRTHILLHVANRVDDIVGCLGVGLTVYPDLQGIGSSRNGLDRFHEFSAGLTKETMTIVTGELK